MFVDNNPKVVLLPDQNFKMLFFFSSILFSFSHFYFFSFCHMNVNSRAVFLWISFSFKKGPLEGLTHFYSKNFGSDVVLYSLPGLVISNFSRCQSLPELWCLWEWGTQFAYTFSLGRVHLNVSADTHGLKTEQKRVNVYTPCISTKISPELKPEKQKWWKSYLLRTHIVKRQSP